MVKSCVLVGLGLGDLSTYPRLGRPRVGWVGLGGLGEGEMVVGKFGMDGCGVVSAGVGGWVFRWIAKFPMYHNPKIKGHGLWC